MCAISSPAVHLDPDTQTVTLTTSGLTLRLRPWSAGTLRVTAAPGPLPPDGASLAVTGAPVSAGWEAGLNGSGAWLASAKMRVTVSGSDGAVTFCKPDGAPLTTLRRWSLPPAVNARRDGLNPGGVFSRADGEHFYGGGAVGDEWRRDGAVIGLANNNTQVRVPVVCSSRGYGVFWDNPARGQISLSADAVAWQFFAGDQADFYFMTGADADAVIGEYRALTGAAPLLPRWALGFWFSKNRFSTQAEVLAAAREFRARRYPIDLLVQDYFYWRPDGGAYIDRWGTHQFDAGRYPDPAAMVRELQTRHHLHFMLVIWPCFDARTAHAAELDAAGALFPADPNGSGPWETGVRFYDPFSEAGRRVYRRQVLEKLGPLRVDAWWLDAAEPEIPNQRMEQFTAGGGPASRVMSAYPLRHAGNVYEMQSAAAADRRVVLLPRSAWAGMQRHAAVNWTGDVNQDWAALPRQIESLLNYSASGLPYITTDIGGYEPTPQADRELFVRWFQWGTFCPVFRAHGIHRPFPWEYGAEAEVILRKFTNLRYRLLPYIYSEAARVTNSGGTLLRPLMMDFPDDARALAVWDQFMFGPALLAAPVWRSAKPPVSAPGHFADPAGNQGAVAAAYLSPSAPAAELKHIDTLGFIDPHFGDALGAVTPRRVEGVFTPAVSGPLALQICEPRPDTQTVTASVNGRPVAALPRAGDWEFPLFPFSASAGRPVRFSFVTQTKRIGFVVVRQPERQPQREVWLPRATWCDFWTGQKFTGGRALTVTAPLETMPLFVRAGAILPLGPELQYADEKNTDPLELRVYRGADGDYTLYEDAGDGYACERGECATIPLAWREQTRTLTIGERRGEFPGMLRERVIRVVFVTPNHGVGEQPAAAADHELIYRGAALTVSDGQCAT